MNRFVNDLYAMAGHWATVACPVINDEISFRMTEVDEYSACRRQADYAVPLLADRLFLKSTYIAAERAGARQFVMLYCGYDTFHIRHSLWYGGIVAFDINPADIVTDKAKRLEKAGYGKLSETHSIACDNLCYAAQALGNHTDFDSDKTTFVHLGGLPCEIDGGSFKQLMEDLFKIIPQTSSVTFSYKSDVYSYCQLEKMLSQAGYHIYEHQTAASLHRDYIYNSELLNNRSFPLSENINYCLAVKK